MSKFINVIEDLKSAVTSAVPELDSNTETIFNYFKLVKYGKGSRIAFRAFRMPRKFRKKR